MMIDYEMELALILQVIEKKGLTAKVTNFIIEVTPGPIDKHINLELQEEVRSILSKSPFKLKELNPLYSYTRITIQRR